MSKERSQSDPSVPLGKRMSMMKDAALGRGEGLTVHSGLSQAHYDTLVDCLLALYEECSSPRLSKDKQVARFVDKYKGVVQELRSLRVSVDDFVLKGVVGRGHFGEVRVVSERSSGQVLAMKVMKKEDILKQSDAAFFQEERDIMAWSCSTWLTSLVYAFQDPLCLYLVMEFHVGGDLLGVMERSPEILDEPGVQFYLAEVAAGLNDLHQLGFVHRDVKPENVLISVTGHIKLVDFGSAARLTGGVVSNAALPVGTPEYIAPEVLTSLDSPSSSAQYGVCCDWWSLGIIGYELLVGVTPFEGDTTAQTYANIMAFRKGLQFPEEVELSPEVKDLFTHLLSSQEERPGFEEIKQFAYFQEVPWTSLPSMPPPLVPKASGQDDTSNFEPPEPSNRPGLPADRHSNRTSGFSGKDLPFIGFTFTRPLGNFPSVEQMESIGGGVVRPLSSEASLFESTLETSEAELSAMISEVREILKSREETLSKVEESHRVLQQEQVIKQSELEELQRALQIERSERQSTEARTLQLLAEVREYHHKIADLKDAKSRENIGQYQKALVHAEQEQKDTGVRVDTLQRALKQQMKETEQANSRVSQMQKKVAELKEQKRKDLVAMQNKIMQSFKESENKTKDLQEQLNATLREKDILEERVRELETEQAAQREEDWRRRMESDSIEERLRSAGEEQLSAELEKAREAAQLLEGETRDLLKKVAHWEVKFSSGESELKELQFALQQQTAEKATIQQTHQLEVSQLKTELQVLENRLKSCEAVNKEAASLKEGESEMTQALQATVVCLKEENSSLMEQLSSERKLASDSTEDTLSLKGLLEREREAMSEAREEIQQLKDSIKQLESAAEQMKNHLQNMKEDSSKSIEQVTDLKRKLDAQESVMQEISADKQSLERRVSVLKEAHAVARADSNKAQESECQLRLELQACKLKSDLAEEQLQAATSQLEDLQALCEEWSSKEGKWSEDKEVLQTELGEAQSRLEETSTLLEKERSLRVEVEEQNDRSLAMFQKSATIHSEEVKRFQENLFRQKGLAEQYSQRITELEQAKAELQTELQDVRTRLVQATQEACTASRELTDTRRELNMLKASHLKLTKTAEEQSSEVQQLAATGRAQQEQLQELLDAKKEQEYRLQTTIAQQSKLIELAIHPRTPTKGHGITKRLKKIIRRGRDPEREVEEWRALRGIIRSKPSPGGTSTSTTTPTGSVRRSGSFLKKFRKSPGVVSQDSMATADSLSIASSLPTSPQSKYSLRKPPQSNSSFALPSLSSSYISIQSDMGMGSSSEEVVGTDVYAGVKRSPRGVVTADKRSMPAPVIAHSIPHKFSSQHGTLRSAKCTHCKAPIQRGNRYSKCTYCKNVYHNKCAKLTPDNCGLPPSLAEYSDDNPPPKRIKADKMVSSSSDEADKADKMPPRSLQQGWVHMYSARGGPGREVSQRWAVLTPDAVRLFTTELAMRRERPLLVYSLTVPTYLEACPSQQDLPPVLQSKASQCFVLKHPGGPSLSSQPLLLMSEEKVRWTTALSQVLGPTSCLREFSIPLDPLDLSKHSNATELSISSDMFSEVL